MGEIIYYRRRAMKIGQKNLCQGICSRGTLSRFENGRQTLSYNRVSALFQRLGLPDNCFYALLSEDELALKEAEREARDASVELERAPAEGRPAAWARLREALGRLEALGRNDPFARQCALSLRAVEGREDGPYPFKERLAMLLEAVRLTVPQFNLERAGLGPYSGEELRLIMLIANTYTAGQRYEEAERVYRIGLEYLEANGRSLPQYFYLKPAYTANYANALAWTGRWQEALELAEGGIAECLEYKRYHVLDTLLWVKAYCCYCLGRREESARLYRQVYSLLLSTREMRRLLILKEQVTELMDIKFEE